MNKLKKNYSCYTYKEKPTQLIYSTTKHKNYKDDIYYYNDNFFKKNPNKKYNYGIEQQNNDQSYSEEKEDLEIKNPIKNKYNNTYKFEIQNKFINIDDGDIKLFQNKNKNKSKQHSINFNTKRKINSKNKQINMNNKLNKTNQIINHLDLNNSNDIRNTDFYNMKNKPIRLNYNYREYDEIMQKIYDKYKGKKNENNPKSNLNNIGNIKYVQERIINLKEKFNFEGSNDEFIKYLKVVKLKAELTQLVEMIFNDGEKLNEDNAKKCFCKLENFLDYKYHENDNILNVYQYLVEKLFELNNFNKDVIMNEI